MVHPTCFHLPSSSLDPNRADRSIDPRDPSIDIDRPALTGQICSSEPPPLPSWYPRPLLGIIFGLLQRLGEMKRRGDEGPGLVWTGATCRSTDLRRNFRRAAVLWQLMLSASLVGETPCKICKVLEDIHGISWDRMGFI